MVSARTKRHGDSGQPQLRRKQAFEMSPRSINYYFFCLKPHYQRRSLLCFAESFQRDALLGPVPLSCRIFFVLIRHKCTTRILFPIAQHSEFQIRRDRLVNNTLATREAGKLPQSSKTVQSFWIKNVEASNEDQDGRNQSSCDELRAGLE
jgi:hypothetical protein